MIMKRGGICCDTTEFMCDHEDMGHIFGHEKVSV